MLSAGLHKFSTLTLGYHRPPRLRKATTRLACDPPPQLQGASVWHPSRTAENFLSTTSLTTMFPYFQTLSEAVTRKVEEAATRGSLEQLMMGFGGFPVSAFVVVSLFLISFMVVYKSLSHTRRRKQNLPPEVPGFPFLGNLPQMTVQKPHKMFTSWAEKYGPVYIIKTGQVKQVIISSPEVAKEALVSKYASICNRSLGTNLMILTRNKSMVAMGDYGERYRLLKKMVVNNLLGQNAQRSLRSVRELYLKSSVEALLDEVNKYPDSTGRVNVRNLITSVMFRLGMHQMFGRDVESVYVPELGGEVTRWEMHDILVQKLMKGAVLIDWRDFFPGLSWFPNRKFVDELKTIERRRFVVTKALIEQHQKLRLAKDKADCYFDVVLENASLLNEDEFVMAVWEPIIESSDTTVVTTEWAMYELARNSNLQEKLYREIRQVVGERMVTEDDLPSLPYLNAVVKETLRKYTPVPVLPPRYVQEEVQLGGYTIPAGCQMIVNVYGIHHDKKQWSDPEVWDPDRFKEDEKFDMGVTNMKVMPFGGGKRICAGISQVFFIVPMTIATLVQGFEWSLPPYGQEDQSTLEETMYLTTQKLVPLEAIVRPRANSQLNSWTVV